MPAVEGDAGDSYFVPVSTYIFEDGEDGKNYRRKDAKSNQSFVSAFFSAFSTNIATCFVFLIS